MKKIIILFFVLFTSAKTFAQCFTYVSAGLDHAMAINTDGTLWGWGSNWANQLGLPVHASITQPTQTGTGADWKSLAAGFGGNHTLALKSDKTLWAWGDGFFGQLGNGTHIGEETPLHIGTDSDWKYIAACDARGFAIKNNGALWAWGSGILGNSTSSTTEYSPIRIGTSSDWKYISAGSAQTVALKHGGTLWVWGGNTYGELGNGTNMSINTPTQIGVSGWKEISAGSGHTIGIKTDGSLWAWGNNSNGQLGDGTTVNKNTPTPITTAKWKFICAGADATYAIKTDGTLWAWGKNDYGQLGNASVIDRNTPTKIGIATDWLMVTSGRSQTFALKNDGSLWAWGRNTIGQLGDGTTVDKLVPTQISCPTVATKNETVTKTNFYPNPVNSYLFVETEQPLNVSIYTIDGRLVFTKSISSSENISTENLENGAYFIDFKTSQTTEKYKLIVVR